MALSSVSVVTNSLRLNRTTLGRGSSPPSQSAEPEVGLRRGRLETARQNALNQEEGRPMGILGWIPFLKKESEIATDPICGTEVHKSNPPGGTARHENVTYFFCGAEDRATFLEDPARHVKAIQT